MYLRLNERMISFNIITFYIHTHAWWAVVACVSSSFRLVTLSCTRLQCVLLIVCLFLFFRSLTNCSHRRQCLYFIYFLSLSLSPPNLTQQCRRRQRPLVQAFKLISCSENRKTRLYLSKQTQSKYPVIRIYYIKNKHILLFCLT